MYIVRSIGQNVKSHLKRSCKSISGIVICSKNSSCTASLGVDDDWWRVDLALAYCLESCVCFILFIVIFHIVQAGENSHGNQVVSLAARVLDGLGSRALNDVGFSIL